ncbi:hypothetical protein B296_00054719 [Ensete ventricosum]|uniref:Uncharacterized protein n=1 Tax=Ensete ventricosum TaxID=4639 RepID=A0A426X459_ENSVE|nr:hypothetical protein B296_00054719 [Ensete ventricosum]
MATAEMARRVLCAGMSVAVSSLADFAARSAEGYEVLVRWGGDRRAESGDDATVDGIITSVPGVHGDELCTDQLLLHRIQSVEHRSATVHGHALELVTSGELLQRPHHPSQEQSEQRVASQNLSDHKQENDRVLVEDGQVFVDAGKACQEQRGAEQMEDSNIARDNISRICNGAFVADGRPGLIPDRSMVFWEGSTDSSSMHAESTVPAVLPGRLSTGEVLHLDSGETVRADVGMNSMSTYQKPEGGIAGLQKHRS